MNPNQIHLDTVIRTAGARLKWSALLVGLCWWLTVCLGLWLALLVLDNLLSLPAGLRLALALGGVAFSLFHLYQKVLRPARHKPTPERTAMQLEQRYAIGENLLINAVQFRRQQLRPDELAFAEKTISMSAEFTDHMRLAELWDWRPLCAWGGAAMLVLVLWGSFMGLFPQQFQASVGRYILPLSDTPPPGDFQLRLTPAADVEVLAGAGLDVMLEIVSPTNKPPTPPPMLVWLDGADFIPPLPGAGENIALTPGGQQFFHKFASLQKSFAFRVFAGNSCTRSIRVQVQSLPQLQNTLLRITPPAYTGRKSQIIAGPPAPISAWPGSELAIAFKVQPTVTSAQWSQAGIVTLLKNKGAVWTGTTLITNSGTYAISGTTHAGAEPVTLAQGEIQVLPDNPPEVDFVTDDRNRIVQFGQSLSFDVAARDDFGLAEISVVVRAAEKVESGTVVKKWTYLGPPGNPGPVREAFLLMIDPHVFEAGTTYYLEALASDFRPGGTPSHSRPIVLRIKPSGEIALPEGDPLEPALAELRHAAASQEKASRLMANFKTYLDDVIAQHAVQKQAKAIESTQNEAMSHARQSMLLFDQQREGKIFSSILTPIVYKNMPEAQTDLRRLDTLAKVELPATVSNIESRLEQILARLLSLLGQVADSRSDALKPVADGKESQQPPAASEAQQKQLLDDTKRFVAEQERILQKSKTLADKGPEDLTQEQKDILGEMAKAEEKWARYFEEKQMDFSKLPQQDFADSSLAQELNSVYQEVQAATNALAEKKMQLAVPAEQSGLENAKQLVNNLERWLPDTPDNIKWSMEEPPAPTDIAMAELPKELEDIVGELLDKEEAMTPDVEDVTSSWMDSLDKGAGWGAGDGPISDMSAKGVTGNQLPNQNEVGGRSGEGRTGRSHGQMVADTAEGKGGRETPTRLDPEPFEQGRVKDTAKNDSGGATGGGKLSGFTGEGLRGPTAPEANQKMPRLAEQQAKIRQQTEALALQLRRYHISGGELETSVNAMQQLENSARKNDGFALRHAFSLAKTSLNQAKQTVTQQVTVRREQDKLPPWMREEIRIGVQDGIPKGYEEQVGEYFRALAEGRIK